MKITMPLLAKLEACSSARRIVEPLLPFVFSTDPEENIDLAIRLLHQYSIMPGCLQSGCPTCRRSLLEDLHWLACQVDREHLSPDVLALSYMTETFSGFDHTTMLAAQSMAIIADVPSNPRKRKR